MTPGNIHPINQSLSIAFDAKRAYQNGTGLGHYSRTLITSLADLFPQHNYYLCAPKLTDRFNTKSYKNIHNITPKSSLAKTLPSIWRSSWVKEDLTKIPVTIYHGLSHEIPIGINETGIKSVVTIHDLIFERYPEQYKWMDVQIYRSKFKYACKYADHVIAISRQTKEDIIQFYGIPENKISICYQSCNPAFQQRVSAEEKQLISKHYDLPPKFLLYVGSVIERKNLLNICKAYTVLGNKIAIPLVVIGEGGSYKKQVESYVAENGLETMIIFLSDKSAAENSPAFKTATDFPAIYQLAEGMIYPSFFEGFGIPVLEALWSGIPVITSNLSCLPETGGDAALYVDPYSPQQIGDAILRIVSDKEEVTQMITKGFEHAKKFTPDRCATAVMEVYLRL